MNKNKQRQAFIYGDNPDFTQGLKFELGNHGVVDYPKALSFYQKAAKKNHFLSLLKVKQTKPRLFTFYPLMMIAVGAMIWGILFNQLWVGLFVLAVSLIVFSLVDWHYYWYKIGWVIRPKPQPPTRRFCRLFSC
jgi:hypothetical protein